MAKNIKKCVICGAEFYSPPTNKTVTCSAECRSERARRAKTGKPVPDEVRKKISESAKQQDRSQNLSGGTAAAMLSEKAGRSPKNSSAKTWTIKNLATLQSYTFTNLNDFIRNNIQLFGENEATDENVSRISAGFRTIKRNMKRKKNCITYKDWQIVDYDDVKNCHKNK